MNTSKNLSFICGWGRFPCIEANVLDKIDFSKSFIPRAYGRSYGDEALYRNVYDTTGLNLFLDVDFEKEYIEVQAGTQLKKILEFLLPRGYVLPVVPGTSLISVGGAIANDIHGKSSKGVFGDFVEGFEIITPKDVYRCSKEENGELFWGTMGSMGLIGIVSKAKLKISKGSQYIRQNIIPTKGIGKAIELLETFDKDYEFSVCWLDAFTENALVMFGDYEYYEHLPLDLKFHFKAFKSKKTIEIPFVMPNFIVNDLDMRAYNIYYFNKMPKGESLVHYFDFFFPLDNIKNWNRLYGKRGFLQYQFVGPKEACIEVFDIIKSYKIYPYLVVLKRLKNTSNRVFSFVKEGFTLALDFPVREDVLNMLYKFDDIVVRYNGLIYMAKDSRVPKEVFQYVYKDQIKALLSLKAKYDENFILKSLMFERLL
ncbi:MAG: FAD-binding oxidoreductase [Hydrogenobaculum sp.]|nr:MAG: FAD-binding oxidoreductase [Hydrogenobaculum sp.]